MVNQGVQQVALGAYLVVEDDCSAFVVRYTVELPSGGNCLPKGVDTALTEEFKVSTSVPGEIWKRIKEQLPEGYKLDLRTRKRAARPLDFTPSKMKNYGKSILTPVH